MILLPLVMAACGAPVELTRGTEKQTPTIASEHVVVSDGTRLPLRKLGARENPKAVVIALHGFNDYSRAFMLAGEFFAKRDVLLLAYDQRGFGLNEPAGIWPGQENLVQDVVDTVSATKAAYRNTPVYLLGESMGGAVVINALAEHPDLPVEGAALTAPAVWARETMPWVHRFMLWFMVHTFPSSEFTGEDLGVMPSDNIPMLKEMGQDPYVIKKTRVDAMYGIVNIMDAAYTNIAQVKKPLLIQYGAKDEVIPELPVKLAMQKLDTDYKAAYYPEGYHMLLRDLKRDVVLSDLESWMSNKQQRLPSGYDGDWDQQHWALAK